MLIAGLHFKPNGEKATEEETLRPTSPSRTLLHRPHRATGRAASLPSPLATHGRFRSDLIAKYGADDSAFGLSAIAPQGADIRFDEKQIEEGRNFWQQALDVWPFSHPQAPGRFQRRAVEAQTLHLRR